MNAKKIKATTVVQWGIYHLISFLQCAEYTFIKVGSAFKISLWVLQEPFLQLVSTITLRCYNDSLFSLNGTYVSCFHRHFYDKTSWHHQILKLKQKLFLKLPILWISQTFPSLFLLTFPNLFLSLFIPQWLMIFIFLLQRATFNLKE